MNRTHKIETVGKYTLERTVKGEFFVYVEGFSEIVQVNSWANAQEYARLGYRPFK